MESERDRLSFDLIWRWARAHPVTVATAIVLVAGLALPFTAPSAPPADFGPDETPLFV